MRAGLSGAGLICDAVPVAQGVEVPILAAAGAGRSCSLKRGFRRKGRQKIESVVIHAVPYFPSVATRYEKKAANFAAFVWLAAGIAAGN